MKIYCLAAVLAIFMHNANGQCKELFFSEYVEGLWNNKALELYNPTSKTVDLGAYRITCWHNGATNFANWYCDTLFGNMAPNSVKVLVINKKDNTATGLDTAVTPALKLKADIWLSQNKYACMSLNFNGDDPISLEKKIGNAWQTVDIIGKIGEQPQLAGSPSTTIGWSDSFPYSEGKGKIYTQNHTLIRKKTINQGVIANPAYFNPKTEWEFYPLHVFDSLGTHSCACNAFAANTTENTTARPTLYPNPGQTTVTINSTTRANKVYALDLQGKKIGLMFTGPESNSVNISVLAPGLYFLVFIDAQGKATSHLFQKA